MNKTCVISLVHLFEYISVVTSKFAFLIALVFLNTKMNYEATESIRTASGFRAGAFYYAKDSGNFNRNSNGEVRFGFF